MTIQNLGIMVPYDYDRESEEEPLLTEFRHFNGDTEDETEEVDATFNIYPSTDDNGVLIGWDLEAVGLVTWHRADTYEEAEAWVYEQIVPWAHLDERGEYVACTTECHLEEEECPGHPDDDYSINAGMPAGETHFCDGSCVR